MSEEKKERLCGTNKFKRPRYFHGMLLDEKDFLAEQSYHIHKRNLINRMLHGWGVVCGLGLQWKKGKDWVKVTPGLALDCCGRDIWVDEPYKIDLKSLLPRPPSRSKDPCGEPNDRDQTKDYYLCIHHREIPVDPVPVYVTGGDCGEKTCDFSKYSEGFCLRLDEDCPKHRCPDGLLKLFCGCGDPDHRRDEPCEPCEPCWEDDCSELQGENRCYCESLNQFCCKPLPCPCCSECSCGEHCVVLGKIRVDQDGCLKGVCLNDCRTYVLSGRMLQYLFTSIFCGAQDWWQICGSDGDKEGLPSPARLIANPIDALCWFARRLVVEDGELKPTDDGRECIKKLFGDKETSAETRFAKKTRQYDAAFEKYDEEIKQRDRAINDYKGQISTLKGRLTRLENRVKNGAYGSEKE